MPGRSSRPSRPTEINPWMPKMARVSAPPIAPSWSSDNGRKSPGLDMATAAIANTAATTSERIGKSGEFLTGSRLPSQGLFSSAATKGQGSAALPGLAHRSYHDLSEDDQDSILADMQENTTTGFEGPSAAAFITQLRNDAIEGMFSDPMYGGNRDLVGWKLNA